MNDQKVILRDVKDVSKIYNAILNTFYSKNKDLLIFIAEYLKNYFQEQFKRAENHNKVFIAYSGEDPIGFISAQLNPNYRSKNKSCGTFGYLTAKTRKACIKLIKITEEFFSAINVRKIRGNVNFPKGLGGTGILLEDKRENNPLFGVPFNDLDFPYIPILEDLGYKQDTLYHSVHVYNKIWENAKKVKGAIRFGYLSPQEILERYNEILNIAKNVFGPILPDTSGGLERIKELLDIYSKVPDSFYNIKDNFDPEKLTDIPEILDAIEMFDPKMHTIWAGFAFDKKTEEIVGVALSIPNLYQMCMGQPITEVNADTMMVKKGYEGRGIFSGMNAMGQLNFKRYGVDYVEGTTIWDKSERVFKKIVPFTKIVRKYVVFQKRLKK
jgi:hypothetical protein